jgi:hypothetical protein
VRIGIALMIVALAGPARADDPDARETTAMKACLAGDVAGGVALLEQLYRASGDSTAIYNQARCFQWNGRYDEAVTRFRQYLREAPALSDADRAEVNQHLAEVERARRPAPVPKDAPAPRALVTAAAVSAAAGVVLAGVGTALLIQAQSQADRVARAMVYDAAADDGARRTRLAGAVMVAAGGAALLAGAVLWLVHRKNALSVNETGLALEATF